MSDHEEARWTEIFAAHPVASRITAKTVAEALRDFPLQPVREMDWLARAIQPAVYSAAEQSVRTKEPAKVRDELKKLALQTRTLCLNLDQMSVDAKEALWQLAYSLPDATDDSAKAEMADYKECWERLIGIVVFLDRASEHAAEQVELRKQQDGASRQAMRAADNEWRKWFAVWLSPAFEIGFERAATLTNPSRETRHKHGHWTDFCECIMRLAYPRWKGTLSRELILAAGEIIRQVRDLAEQRGESAATVLRFRPGWFPKDRHSS